MHDCIETGKLLSSFAESMKLPFVLRYSMQKRMSMIKFVAGETVGVFMDHSLRFLSAYPNNVENLLMGLKSLSLKT